DTSDDDTRRFALDVKAVRAGGVEMTATSVAGRTINVERKDDKELDARNRRGQPNNIAIDQI
ncbi:hypothetical protein Dimus_003299, partial [Dionaea muscipula]